MGELAKIESFKREIALAETWEDWKNLTIKGDLLADLAKKSGIAIKGQNELGRTRIELESLKGKYLNDNFRQGGTGANQYKNAEVKELDLCKMENEGISKTESARARIITNRPEIVEEVMNEIEEKGEVITPGKVAAGIRHNKKEQDKKKKIEKYKEQAEKYNDNDIQIFCKDFREYSKNIKDNSIDAIITDPPYPGEYLNLWQDLFHIANRILKPSSFLICYSGQMYLDKIFRMDNELIYYWTANIIFSKKPLISGRNIINEWKPILMFQKPPFKLISDTISDTISFNYSERDMHNDNWGQTIRPFEFLIEHFSNPGDIIFEPFAGTGTTLIACRNKKRKCIGIEINPEYIDLIKGRLINEK